MKITPCSAVHLLNTSTMKNRLGIFRISSPRVRLINDGIQQIIRGNSCSLHGLRVARTESGSACRGSPLEFAILLEVDGVLMDVHRVTNRLSFNTAFRKKGLDCANWGEPVYQDLFRRAGGDEEKMLFLYFDQIGWPTSLPTSEKDSFVKSLLREKKATSNDINPGDMRLRPGVVEFIDDAVKDGIPVIILAAYGKLEERTQRSIAERLGNDIVSRIKVIGRKEVEQSMYGRVMLGKSFPNEALAQEILNSISEEKARIAKEVASLLKLKVMLSEELSETALQSIVAAQRAGAEYADVAVTKCILVAGTQYGLAASQRIGMPCVVVRSSLMARAEFPAARGVYDGFGESELTVSRLITKI